MDHVGKAGSSRSRHFGRRNKIQRSASSGSDSSTSWREERDTFIRRDSLTRSERDQLRKSYRRDHLTGDGWEIMDKDCVTNSARDRRGYLTRSNSDRDYSTNANRERDYVTRSERGRLTKSGRVRDKLTRSNRDKDHYINLDEQRDNLIKADSARDNLTNPERVRENLNITVRDHLHSTSDSSEWDHFRKPSTKRDPIKIEVDDIIEQDASDNDHFLQSYSFPGEKHENLDVEDLIKIERKNMSDLDQLKWPETLRRINREQLDVEDIVEEERNRSHTKAVSIDQNRSDLPAPVVDREYLDVEDITVQSRNGGNLNNADGEHLMSNENHLKTQKMNIKHLNMEDVMKQGVEKDQPDTAEKDHVNSDSVDFTNEQGTKQEEHERVEDSMEDKADNSKPDSSSFKVSDDSDVMKGLGCKFKLLTNGNISLS